MSTTISGDKMLSHIDRVLNDHRPITADIFLTNYCNNNCPYCTYHRWELEKGTRYMAFADFEIYATRLLELGVQGIILTGGGEPTVNPDFIKICHWLESNGIDYGINTNFNKYVEIRPNYLKVSLDGWDEDSYELSRGVRRYNQVRKNIQAYAAWKKAHGVETSLGVQMVVSKPEDVERFYNANADLDVDYLVFRPQESTGGIAYKGDVEKRLAAISVEKILELGERDSRVSLNFKWQMLDVRESNCVAQWAQIALDERGNVIYCCHKPYEVIGHIMDEDILEKKAKAVTNMAMCDVPCRMTAPNAFVVQMQKTIPDACFI